MIITSVLFAAGRLEHSYPKYYVHLSLCTLCNNLNMFGISYGEVKNGFNSHKQMVQD